MRRSYLCILLLLVLLVFPSAIGVKAQYTNLSVKPVSIYAGGLVTVSFSVVESFPGKPKPKTKLLGFEVRFIPPRGWKVFRGEIWGYDEKDYALASRGYWKDNMTAVVVKGSPIVNSKVTVIMQPPVGEGNGTRTIYAVVHATVLYSDGTVRNVSFSLNTKVSVVEWRPRINMTIGPERIIPPGILRGEVDIFLLNPLPKFDLRDVHLKLTIPDMGIVIRDQRIARIYYPSNTSVTFVVPVRSSMPGGKHEVLFEMTYKVNDTTREVVMKRYFEVYKPANLTIKLISWTSTITPGQEAVLRASISNPSNFIAYESQLHVMTANGEIYTENLGDLPPGGVRQVTMNISNPSPGNVSVWASWYNEGASVPSKTPYLVEKLSIWNWEPILVAALILGGALVGIAFWRRKKTAEL